LSDNCDIECERLASVRERTFISDRYHSMARLLKNHPARLQQDKIDTSAKDQSHWSSFFFVGAIRKL